MHSMNRRNLTLFVVLVAVLSTYFPFTAAPTEAQLGKWRDRGMDKLNSLKPLQRAAKLREEADMALSRKQGEIAAERDTAPWFGENLQLIARGSELYMEPLALLVDEVHKDAGRKVSSLQRELENTSTLKKRARLEKEIYDQQRRELQAESDIAYILGKLAGLNAVHQGLLDLAKDRFNLTRPTPPIKPGLSSNLYTAMTVNEFEGYEQLNLANLPTPTKWKGAETEMASAVSLVEPIPMPGAEVIDEIVDPAKELEGRLRDLFDNGR